MITIRTYSDNGPYWPSTVMKYQAACLKDVIFHTRLAMEENEQYIGAFNEDGTCYGLWEEDGEPEPDGEGGWWKPRHYTFRRPGGRSAKAFVMMAEKMK